MQARLLLLAPVLHENGLGWDELFVLIPGVLLLAVIGIVAAWASKNKEQKRDE